MLDQSYMRYWAADHEQFSRDLHSALVAFGRFTKRGIGKLATIDRVYTTGRTARGMIAGLAASATTTLLFFGIGALSLSPGALA